MHSVNICEFKTFNSNGAISPSNSAKMDSGEMNDMFEIGFRALSVQYTVNPLYNVGVGPQ